MGEKKVEYLTKKRFAELNGWSPSYVTKLKDQGKLVLDPSGKLVDVKATIDLLESLADPSKRSVKDHHARQREARESDAEDLDHQQKQVTGKIAEEGKDDGELSDNQTYWKAKARSETAKAELAEIELWRARGSLVEKADVQRGIYAASRMLRDMILAVPNRIAAQLVATGDAGAAQRMMREELRGALEKFASLSADQIEGIGD